MGPWYGFTVYLFWSSNISNGSGDEEKREGIQEKKSYTTPRTLLALMRLSQVVKTGRKRVAGRTWGCTSTALFNLWLL